MIQSPHSPFFEVTEEELKQIEKTVYVKTRNKKSRVIKKLIGKKERSYYIFFFC